MGCQSVRGVNLAVNDRRLGMLSLIRLRKKVMNKPSQEAFNRIIYPRKTRRLVANKFTRTLVPETETVGTSNSQE